MSISIIGRHRDKPDSSEVLVTTFKNSSKAEGQLFVGYPFVKDSEGLRVIDALLISPKYGIVVFDLVEGSNLKNYKSRQDDDANLLDVRLRMKRELTIRRKLIIPINTLTFAPRVQQNEYTNINTDYPIVTSDGLEQQLEQFKWNDSNTDACQLALSVIENISNVRAGKKIRIVNKSGSRGEKLKKLEDTIATMDLEQQRAVIHTVNGVQRIRGLAGSGKTIVLALKAAQLHLQYPKWRIAVTFHTRALHGFFRRLIRNFCVDISGEEPNWHQLRIVNSWGSPARSDYDGLYLEFCRKHGLEFFDFSSASKRFGGRNSAFAHACQHAIDQRSQTKLLKERYDVILVDEAQDLPDAFLKMCYEFLTDSRQLVYAYDELQNLYGKSVSEPEDLFGNDSDGKPRVHLKEEGSDIILKTCYRNSRPLLVTAHALGFGIYRKSVIKNTTGLVQMFENDYLWNEIGYQVETGELRAGSKVTLVRTEKTSPTFLENHSDIDDLIQFHCLDNKKQQAEWVANEIKNNIDNDELRPDDVIVINLNPMTIREDIGPIRFLLSNMGIQSHLAGVDTDPNVFYRDNIDSVTFTSIHRAKGNEAAMVYVINTQDCNQIAGNLASNRNRLFVAITRSKAWVRIVGIGAGIKIIEFEYRSIIKNNFKLCFSYPTADQLAKLRTIYRDQDVKERQLVDGSNQYLHEIIDRIDSGQICLEDLDPGMLDHFKTMLTD